MDSTKKLSFTYIVPVASVLLVVLLVGGYFLVRGIPSDTQMPAEEPAPVDAAAVSESDAALNAARAGLPVKSNVIAAPSSPAETQVPVVDTDAPPEQDNERAAVQGGTETTVSHTSAGNVTAVTAFDDQNVVLAGSVQVTADPTAMTNAKEASATIMAIDTKAGIILAKSSASGELLKIWIKKATVLVGEVSATVEALQVSDIINVSGTGEADSNEIIATKIQVTGVEETVFVPDNGDVRVIENYETSN